MTVRNIRAHQSRGLLPPPGGPRPHGLLRARARRAPAPDPGAAGQRLQPRRDQGPRRADERLLPGRARLRPRDPDAVRGRAARGHRRRRARRALRRPRRRPEGAAARREARDRRPAGRGPLRGAEPDAPARGGDAARPRDPAREVARGHRGRRAPGRQRGRRVREALPRPGLEAVRPRRAARAGLAGRARRARAAAPARHRGARGDLPAAHDAGGREGVRARAGPARQEARRGQPHRRARLPPSAADRAAPWECGAAALCSSARAPPSPRSLPRAEAEPRRARRSLVRAAPKDSHHRLARLRRPRAPDRRRGRDQDDPDRRGGPDRRFRTLGPDRQGQLPPDRW